MEKMIELARVCTDGKENIEKYWMLMKPGKLMSCLCFIWTVYINSGICRRRNTHQHCDLAYRLKRILVFSLENLATWGLLLTQSSFFNSIFQTGHDSVSYICRMRYRRKENMDVKSVVPYTVIL